MLISMRDQFLFSLRKINYMKYFVVLFCLISSMSFAQKGRNQANSASQPVSQPVQSVSTSDVDQIFQLILSDFSSELNEMGNKPSTVIILESNSEMLGKRYVIGGINYITGGKPEILNNNGISIAFWRLDISESKAHIEFYYTDSKNQTQHKEYLLTKENAVWRK